MRTRRRTRLRSKICDTCKKVIDARDNIVDHLKQCQNFYEITENSDDDNDNEITENAVDDDTKIAENFNDDNEITENSNDDNDITENSNDDKDITGNAVDNKEITENSDDDNEIIVLDDFFGRSKTNSDQISRDFYAQRQTVKRTRSESSSQEQMENKRQNADKVKNSLGEGNGLLNNSQIVSQDYFYRVCQQNDQLRLKVQNLEKIQKELEDKHTKEKENLQKQLDRYDKDQILKELKAKDEKIETLENEKQEILEITKSKRWSFFDLKQDVRHLVDKNEKLKNDIEEKEIEIEKATNELKECQRKLNKT